MRVDEIHVCVVYPQGPCIVCAHILYTHVHTCHVNSLCADITHAQYGRLCRIIASSALNAII